MRLRTPLLLMVLSVLLLLVGCNMAEQSSVAQPVEQISTVPPDATCAQVLTLAETTVGLVCDTLGRNQACYGNTRVSVDLKPNIKSPFTKSGDIIDLLSIQRLFTSPLNMETKEWGIAVLKAQANLPASLPGQNVTFLLFGDARVDNPTPDMTAVTISTGIGQTECEEAPQSAVMIQSPEGSQVAMNINGTDVTLGSTAYITTNPETQRMTFAVLEGTGVVSAFGETRVVLPGFKTGVQLGGGPDGLQASGPPNEPAPYDFANIQHAPVQLLDRQVPIPPAGGEGGVVPTATSTVVSTPPPTQAAACTPRADWQFRYVIQRGDNLSIIAQRLNMRTADLQAGNCIANPNQLIAGQTLRTPREVPPPPPTAVPTSAATATQAGMTGPNLRADQNSVYYGQCTTIRWDVDNIQAVYFEGQPVIGHDSRQVCPSDTTTYTLMVVLTDGSQRTFPITITVVNTCGNNVCEPDYGEDSETCPSDCYIIS